MYYVGRSWNGKMTETKWASVDFFPKHKYRTQACADGQADGAWEPTPFHLGFLLVFYSFFVSLFFCYPVEEHFAKSGFTFSHSPSFRVILVGLQLCKPLQRPVLQYICYCAHCQYKLHRKQIHFLNCFILVLYKGLIRLKPGTVIES